MTIGGFDSPTASTPSAGRHTVPKPPKTHERADLQSCHKCGEPVFFATTVKQGRPVPLNPEPRHAYTLKWVHMGTPQGGHFLARYQIVYETHIETCVEGWKGD